MLGLTLLVPLFSCHTCRRGLQTLAGSGFFLTLGVQPGIIINLKEVFESLSCSEANGDLPFVCPGRPSECPWSSYKVEEFQKHYNRSHERLELLIVCPASRGL